MASTNNMAADDELDDLLNVDDSELSNTSNILPRNQNPSNQQKDAGVSANLGIDDEIKITKKRQPIPKLDAPRLLSHAGVPKLRRISKDRLRFKGKGHEYSDIARFLNMYQLWLDELYPRAKFADGLAIIEKLGHTKRMQIMRKEWIEEGKPKSREDELDEDNSFIVDGMNGNGQAQEQTAAAFESTNEAVNAFSRVEASSTDQEPDQPDEDELDALLAEAEGGQSNDAHSAPIPVRIQNSKSIHEDEFADEMEVMAGMEEMW